MNGDIEIVVFNDKSWVRFSEYEKLEKENEKLKLINKKMQCCKNCKKYRMLESQVSLRCLKNRRINFCCEEWELAE